MVRHARLGGLERAVVREFGNQRCGVAGLGPSSARQAYAARAVWRVKAVKRGARHADGSAERGCGGGTARCVRRRGDGAGRGAVEVEAGLGAVAERVAARACQRGRLATRPAARRRPCSQRELAAGDMHGAGSVGSVREECRTSGSGRAQGRQRWERKARVASTCSLDRMEQRVAAYRGASTSMVRRPMACSDRPTSPASQDSASDSASTTTPTGQSLAACEQLVL